MGRLDVRELGVVEYGEALRVQDELVKERRAGEIGDTLLLLEHPHVITMGSGTDPAHVLIDADRRAQLEIGLHETGRGGDVTYHGPGQLVGYPILQLPSDRKDLHRYLRDLESVLITALEHWEIDAFRREGLTGVWTEGGKIAALGIRVSSGWITSHGFALNVDPDLHYFDTIVPCGIQDEEVTSIRRETGVSPAHADVTEAILQGFSEVFHFETE